MSRRDNVPAELRAIYYEATKDDAARPGFVFYPDKWLSDTDLQRCTDAEQGVWIRVLCILHGSPEYGVVRWPLRELARAARTTTGKLRKLLAKGVLRGAEKGETCEILTYFFSKKHTKLAGSSVTILHAQPGPIFFCARFCRDEFIRLERGKHGQKAQFSPNVANPKPRQRRQEGREMVGEMGTIGPGEMPTTMPPPLTLTLTQEEEKTSLPQKEGRETAPIEGEIEMEENDGPEPESGDSEAIGPKSSSGKLRTEAIRLKKRLEELVPGALTEFESWKAAVPHGKKWTAWGQVLKLRGMIRIAEGGKYTPEQVISMLQVAAGGGWGTFRIEYWRNATRARGNGNGRPGKAKPMQNREGAGLIDLEASGEESEE